LERAAILANGAELTPEDHGLPMVTTGISEPAINDPSLNDHSRQFVIENQERMTATKLPHKLSR